MWNVVGPFEAGSPADLAVVSEVVQSQNRCLYLVVVEEVSELQIVVTVGDSAVVEGEDHSVDGEGGSVEAEAASVADVMTLGVVDVVVATAAAVAVADSGMYCVPHLLNCDSLAFKWWQGGRHRIPRRRGFQ